MHWRRSRCGGKVSFSPWLIANAIFGKRKSWCPARTGLAYCSSDLSIPSRYASVCNTKIRTVQLFFTLRECPIKFRAFNKYSHIYVQSEQGIGGVMWLSVAPRHIPDQMHSFQKASAIGYSWEEQGSCLVNSGLARDLVRFYNIAAFLLIH